MKTLSAALMVLCSSLAVAADEPPVMTFVSLTPSTAYEASTLLCTPGSRDPNGRTVTYSYSWVVNGAANAQTGAALTGTYFAKGNAVACVVTPSNGALSGSSMMSNTIVISNSAPSATAASLAPAGATANDTLTCSGQGATDADGDPVTFHYAWKVNGAAVPETTNMLAPQHFAAGKSVVCVATPHDGTASGTPRSSTAITIAAPPPVLTAFIVDAASVRAGNPVTGRVTIDADAPSAGLSLRLSSSSTAVKLPPLAISAGMRSAEFSLSTEDVAAATPVTLTVAAPRGGSMTSSVTILPGATLSQVTISSPLLGVGANAQLTVMLDGPAGARGRTVTLSSSNPAVIAVPASVLIAEGQSQAVVALSALAPGTATVSASVGRTRKSVSVSVIAPR
jgi:hypothetical protein